MSVGRVRYEEYSTLEKMLKKNYKMTPKAYAMIEHKYTRHYSKGKNTAKSTLYLQKNDLKTLWFSLQIDAEQE